LGHAGTISTQVLTALALEDTLTKLRGILPTHYSDLFEISATLRVYSKSAHPDWREFYERADNIPPTRRESTSAGQIKDAQDLIQAARKDCATLFLRARLRQ